MTESKLSDWILIKAGYYKSRCNRFEVFSYMVGSKKLWHVDDLKTGLSYDKLKSLKMAKSKILYLRRKNR